MHDEVNKELPSAAHAACRSRQSTQSDSVGSRAFANTGVDAPFRVRSSEDGVPVAHCTDQQVNFAKKSLGSNQKHVEVARSKHPFFSPSQLPPSGMDPFALPNGPFSRIASYGLCGRYKTVSIGSQITVYGAGRTPHAQRRAGYALKSFGGGSASQERKVYPKRSILTLSKKPSRGNTNLPGTSL